MADTVLLKFKRGTYSSLSGTSVPPYVDGTLYYTTDTSQFTAFDSLGDTTGTATTNPWHFFFVDSSLDGTGDVTRKPIDAWRAVWARKAKAADSATALTSGQVGGEAKPIYFDSNSQPAAMTGDVGSTTKFIYMDDGELKATTANVGAQDNTANANTFKPIYMASGVLTAASATIGSSSKPIWMDQGVLKVITGTMDVTSSSTNSYAGGAVGDEHTPIYLDTQGIPQATTDVFSNSKNNTVTGVTTFNANVVMSSSVTADSLTAGSLVVSGNTSLVNTTTTANIIPSAHNTYDIGTSTVKYKNVYAVKFVGNLNGTADYASALSAGAGSTALPVYINANGVPATIDNLTLPTGSGKGAISATSISVGTGTITSGLTIHNSSSNATFKFQDIKAETDNDTHYLWFADKDSVGVPAYHTGLTYNPSTGTITATKFSGALEGTASAASALNSGQVGSAGDDPASDTAASGGLPVYFNSNGQPAAVTSLDGTKIVGMIPLKWIPKGAIERLVVVTSENAMKALSADDVQIGDSVRIVTSSTTDVDLLYYVIDSDAISTAGDGVITGTNFGFVPYSAGSASYAVSAGSATSAAQLSNQITFTIQDSGTGNNKHSTTTAGTNLSSNVTMTLPATITAELNGNAKTATSAGTATTANGLAKKLTVTLTNVNGSDSTLLNAWKATSNGSFNISAASLFPVLAGTCTTTATSSAVTWTAVTMTDAITLAGSYMIQISDDSNNYWTGVFSYTATNAASDDNDTDEILLHSAGTSANLYRVFARTKHVAGGAMILQCGTDTNAAKSLTIKVRRFI